MRLDVVELIGPVKCVRAVSYLSSLGPHRHYGDTSTHIDVAELVESTALGDCYAFSTRWRFNFTSVSFIAYARVGTPGDAPANVLAVGLAGSEDNPRTFSPFEWNSLAYVRRRTFNVQKLLT